MRCPHVVCQRRPPIVVRVHDHVVRGPLTLRRGLVSGVSPLNPHSSTQAFLAFGLFLGARQSAAVGVAPVQVQFGLVESVDSHKIWSVISVNKRGISHGTLSFRASCSLSSCTTDVAYLES